MVGFKGGSGSSVPSVPAAAKTRLTSRTLLPKKAAVPAATAAAQNAVATAAAASGGEGVSLSSSNVIDDDDGLEDALAREKVIDDRLSELRAR